MSNPDAAMSVAFFGGLGLGLLASLGFHSLGELKRHAEKQEELLTKFSGRLAKHKSWWFEADGASIYVSQAVKVEGEPPETLLRRAAGWAFTSVMAAERSVENNAEKKEKDQ